MVDTISSNDGLLPVQEAVPDVRFFFRKLFVISDTKFNSLVSNDRSNIVEVQSGVVKASGRHAIYAAAKPSLTDNTLDSNALSAVMSSTQTNNIDNFEILPNAAYELMFGVKSIHTNVDVNSPNSATIEIELPVFSNLDYTKVARLVTINDPRVTDTNLINAVGDDYDVHSQLAPYLSVVDRTIDQQSRLDLTTSFSDPRAADRERKARARMINKIFRHTASWIPIIDPITKRKTIFQPMDKVYIQGSKYWNGRKIYHGDFARTSHDVSKGYATVFTGVVDSVAVSYNEGTVSITLRVQGTNKWIRRSHWNLSPSLGAFLESQRASGTVDTNDGFAARKSRRVSTDSTQAGTQPPRGFPGFTILGEKVNLAVLGSTLASLRLREIVQLMYVGPKGAPGNSSIFFNRNELQDELVGSRFGQAMTPEQIKLIVNTHQQTANALLGRVVANGALQDEEVTYTGVGDFQLLESDNLNATTVESVTNPTDIDEQLRSSKFGIDLLDHSRTLNNLISGGGILPRSMLRLLEEGVYKGWAPYAVSSPTMSVADSQLQSRMDIVKKMASYVMFDYYEDQFGIVWFRPPSYHKNPTRDYQIIDDIDIISETHTEDDSNVVTQVFITGDAQYGGLRQDLDQNFWWFSMDAAWNPALEERYGIPVLHQMSVPGFGRFRTSNDQLRDAFSNARKAVAYAYMNRENRRLFSSDITINFRPEISPGICVAILNTISDGAVLKEVRDTLVTERSIGDIHSHVAIDKLSGYMTADNSKNKSGELMVGYVTKVSHNVDMGSKPTTTLTLSYRRSWNTTWDELAETASQHINKPFQESFDPPPSRPPAQGGESNVSATTQEAVQSPPSTPSTPRAPTKTKVCLAIDNAGIFSQNDFYSIIATKSKYLGFDKSGAQYGDISGLMGYADLFRLLKSGSLMHDLSNLVDIGDIDVSVITNSNSSVGAPPDASYALAISPFILATKLSNAAVPGYVQSDPSLTLPQQLSDNFRLASNVSGTINDRANVYDYVVAIDTIGSNNRPEGYEAFLGRLYADGHAFYSIADARANSNYMARVLSTRRYNKTHIRLYRESAARQSKFSSWGNSTKLIHVGMMMDTDINLVRKLTRDPDRLGIQDIINANVAVTYKWILHALAEYVKAVVKNQNTPRAITINESPVADANQPDNVVQSAEALSGLQETARANVTYLLKRFNLAPIVLAQTSGGVHVRNSAHFQRRAVDFGIVSNSKEKIDEVFAALLFVPGIEKMFYRRKFYRNVHGESNNNGLWTSMVDDLNGPGGTFSHDNHLHITFKNNASILTDNNLSSIVQIVGSGAAGKTAGSQSDVYSLFSRWNRIIEAVISKDQELRANSNRKIRNGEMINILSPNSGDRFPFRAMGRTVNRSQNTEVDIKLNSLRRYGQA